MRIEEIWMNAAKEAEKRALAGCRAVGSAAYLFNPGCDLTDAERLERFAEIFTDLAAALELDNPTCPHSARNTLTVNGCEAK